MVTPAAWWHFHSGEGIPRALFFNMKHMQRWIAENNVLLTQA
jgi:hypothetical protein